MIWFCSRSASTTIAQSATETTCTRDYVNIPGAANVSFFIPDLTIIFFCNYL